MQVLDRPDATDQDRTGWTPGRRPPARAGRQGASPDQVVALLGLVAAAHPGLPDVLHAVAARAHALAPGADGVVVAVRRPSGMLEVAATDADAREVDALQRGLREGPVLDAVAAGLPAGTGRLTGEDRWPRLATAVGTLDVQSVLSLPVVVDGAVLGTVSAYARRPEAFVGDEDEHGAAAALARLAGEVGPEVEAALVLEQGRSLTVRGAPADLDRSVVERAIAVLADEHGVGREEGLAALQLLGRTEEQDLGTAARAVVRSATGSPAGEHGRRPAG